MHNVNGVFLLYNKIGDHMKYITRDMLQGKLKEIPYYPVTCFYAPRGSGKTQQIRSCFKAGHIRRKWIDLYQYPHQSKKKIEELKQLCIQLDAEVILILQHYTAAYTDIIQTLIAERKQPLLLVSDEIQNQRSIFPYSDSLKVMCIARGISNCMVK